jgi:hypothetical protein
MIKMKKLFFLFLVACGALFGLQSVWADPPVPPPQEGFLIHTDTDITCVGTVIETESFEWHWNNDAVSGNTQGIQPPLLDAGESEARIVYNEEFRSQNSLVSGESERGIRGEGENGTPPTEYSKEFTADSHADDGLNLEVDKTIGYTSNGAAGSTARLTEEAAIEVVSAGGGGVGGGFAGILALCPWNVTRAGTFNAVNTGVAMGSQFFIPNLLADGGEGQISFISATDASVTAGVSLGYDVNAAGRGQIEAEMIARLYEGNAAATRGANVAAGTAPGLNSVIIYSERAEADGIFAPFHRTMLFQSAFAQPSPNQITLDLFN